MPRGGTVSACQRCLAELHARIGGGPQRLGADVDVKDVSGADWDFASVMDVLFDDGRIEVKSVGHDLLTHITNAHGCSWAARLWLLRLLLLLLLMLPLPLLLKLRLKELEMPFHVVVDVCVCSRSTSSADGETSYIPDKPVCRVMHVLSLNNRRRRKEHKDMTPFA